MEFLKSWRENKTQSPAQLFLLKKEKQEQLSLELLALQPVTSFWISGICTIKQEPLESHRAHAILAYTLTFRSKPGTEPMALHGSCGPLISSPALTPARTPTSTIVIHSCPPTVCVNAKIRNTTTKPLSATASTPQKYVYPDPIPEFAESVSMFMQFARLNACVFVQLV